MKNRFTITVLLIAASLVVSSNALPARKRMIYYQQPVPAQYYAAPQRMMYVHQYVQPNERSAQAASALVAGETVATGTYLEDCDHGEAGIAAAGPAVQQGEDVLSVAGVHSSQSVAEAYPDDSNAPGAVPPSRDLTIQTETESESSVVADLPTDDKDAAQVPVVSDDEAKVPRDYNFDANEPAPPATGVELPAPGPIAPVATPGRRYLSSKKKVYVELDHASAETAGVEQPDSENAVAVADDEEVQEGEEEEQEAAVVPVAPKKPLLRRPVAKKPSKSAADCSDCAKKAGSSGSSSSKPQIPAGTFFPIDFGGTAGGAIAIANSFSTGEGGSATSHAIAYGSPDAARGRVRPSKLH